MSHIHKFVSTGRKSPGGDDDYDTSEGTRFNRMSIARGLGEYMARVGYQAYIAPRKQGWVRRESYQPYIFTDEQIGALFFEMEAKRPFLEGYRQDQLIFIFRLLYSTGMRVGEVCALTKSDVDLVNGLITVRHSKNDKDRRLPLHQSTLERLRGYWSQISLEPFWERSSYLFAQPGRITINQRAVYDFFRQSLWRAGISHGGRGKGPRVHDIRFTFACHRLRGWVREGADINALLPYLAAYMGHADTRCTEYYLKLTADLYPDITAAVDEGCGWMIPGSFEDGSA